MSSLKASFNLFRDDNTTAAARNAQFQKRQNGATTSNPTKAPISTPSPRPSTPSISAPPSDLKRKRQELAENASYSQPQDTGSGREVMTKVVYSIEWLKAKEIFVSFEDIWSYLSIPENERGMKPVLRRALMEHPKVEFEPGVCKDKDGKTVPGFRFRPMHNVRSADELIGYLQRQSTAQGINVKELKDGWSTAVAEIDALEAKGELLVTRNKKDNTPKMVWANDPSLSLHIDQDFQDYWHKIRIPEDTDIRNDLIKAGLTPTSQVKEVIKVGGAREKKKRVSRKIGRSTNLHMTGILKDYSAVAKR